MKFSAAFIAAALPFLVAGAAIEREAEPLTIPLVKRASSQKDRIAFHLTQKEALKAYVISSAHAPILLLTGYMQ